MSQPSHLQRTPRILSSLFALWLPTLLLVALLAIVVAAAMALLGARAPGPWRDPVKVLPLIALSMIMFVSGWGFHAWRASAGTTDNSALTPVLGISTVVAVAALAIILVDGSLTGVVATTKAALVLLGGVLSLLVGASAIDTVRRSEGVTLETHWGGLGGGLGGTRISAAAVLVFLLLILSSATIMVGVLSPADWAKGLASTAGATLPGTAGNGPPATSSSGETVLDSAAAKAVSVASKKDPTLGAPTKAEAAARPASGR